MLEIKNNDIPMISSFLRDNLVANNSIENIHKMRVAKNLESYLAELEKERVEIIKQYVETDENGEIIQDENGKTTCYDTENLNKELNALFSESYFLNDENLKRPLETIKKLLENFEGELSGDASEAHYILVEKLAPHIEQEEV